MNRPRPDLYRLVHSTDQGRICPTCRRPARDCRCPAGKRTASASAAHSAAPSDGFARVRLEKKGRGGKTVTVITGLTLDEPALLDLTKTLKRKAGSGGTLKDGRIELQGDHATLVLAELAARKLPAKRAGGGA